MPKIFGKNIPPVVLGGAGILALYLGYTTLFPGDDTQPARPKSKPVVKSSATETDYLPTDYTFTIAPLPPSVTPKDAFKPLVYKANNVAAGGIPSIDNYTYSGMAQLNGVANGLLENGQTGQGDFVQPGEHWHSTWLVVRVTPDEIALRNSDTGVVTQLEAGAASVKALSAGASASVGANANPVMVGPIGSNDLSVQADVAQPQAQTGRRRRGGGRRGGGGGGGGGNVDGG